MHSNELEDTLQIFCIIDSVLVIDVDAGLGGCGCDFRILDKCRYLCRLEKLIVCEWHEWCLVFDITHNVLIVRMFRRWWCGRICRAVYPVHDNVEY